MALKEIICIVGCIALFVGQIQSEGTIYPCPAFGIRRVEHSSSCDKYVQCFAGTAVVRNCGPNLHYNKVEEKCMSPTEAKCTRDKDLCPLFNDPTNLIYHQDLAECGKYYLCYNNKMHEYTCAEGLHWDTVNERCAYPEDAECGLYEIICPALGTAQVPHPYICSRFYLCIDGVHIPNACPEGLEFDINIMNCNHPGPDRCITSVTNPATNTPPTTITTTTESTTTTTTQSTTTTTVDPGFVFNCPSREFQVFPHPTRGCKWYVVCDVGEAQEWECPLYMIYFHRLAICVPGACN